MTTKDVNLKQGGKEAKLKTQPKLKVGLSTSEIEKKSSEIRRANPIPKEILTGKGRPDFPEKNKITLVNSPNDSPKVKTASSLTTNKTLSDKRPNSSKRITTKMSPVSSSEQKLKSLVYWGSAGGGVFLFLIIMLVMVSRSRSLQQDISTTKVGVSSTKNSSNNSSSSSSRSYYSGSSSGEYRNKQPPELKLDKIPELDGGMTYAEYMKKHNTLQESELYQTRMKLRKDYESQKKSESTNSTSSSTESSNK